jgi:hypothetical protein
LIPTGKTIQQIYLWICDGVGEVRYDYIKFYKGTYTIPVVTKMPTPQKLKDVITEIPGMSGNFTDELGTDLLEVTMTCDLDLEPTSVLWKRPQTTGVDDYNNTDIFYETQHDSGREAASVWTWLNLGNPAMQFKARLIDIQPDFSGGQGAITLLWREYRHGTAADESAIERYGLNL